MKVLEVEFRAKVKFPSGRNGQGKNIERMLIDHPESPNRDYAMVWAPVNGSFELVVTHVRSGISVGVPRENVAWCRPSLSELLTAAKADVKK